MPLPDYMLPVDEDTVRQRILDRLSDELDKSEGSFLWDAIMPTAQEFVLADDRLRYVFDLGFAATTFGEFLDLRSEEHGVTRKPATPSTGEATFTGVDTTVIPAGTEISTPGTEATPAVTFTTDEEVVIAAGTAIAAITSASAGETTNIGADQIILLVTPIADVTGVTNSATTGGTNEETDEALLERLLIRVQNPGTSGNAADYKNWALEVAGVGGAAVVPIEDGPGTVTVAIVDEDRLPAGAGLVTDVQDYIAPGGTAAGTGRAPVGAVVTIEAAGAITVDVAATIDYEAGADEPAVQQAIEDNIAAHLAAIAFSDDNDVRFARIVVAILDTPGVDDATAITIEAATADIAVGVKDVAVLGVTAWS